MSFVEYQNTSKSGSTRVWRITRVGDEVITEFGQLGGKMQQSVDYGKEKNKGKINYLTAEMDAINLMERLIKQKVRAGYRLLDNFAGGLRTEEDLIFRSETLPENLCFYKPYNSVSDHMTGLMVEGNGWAIKKYDGEMMIIRKTEGGEIQMYSRRLRRTHHLEDSGWEKRFPHFVEALKGVPCNSLLLGEVISAPEDGEDDRWSVASVLKSKTDKAIFMQSEEGWLRFVVWDIAWWDGEILLGNHPVGDRLELAINTFSENNIIMEPEILPVMPYSLEDLTELVMEEGWEGLVLVDPTATYGTVGFNFRGKADRPKKFCCKLKPSYEDDFIARWNPDQGLGTYGRGKNTGKLGSVALYQYDREGNLIYICNCGNGWSDDFIKENSSIDAWPKVIQVKYESRTYSSLGHSTNALQFPRFASIRDDKEAEECINPEL